MNGLTKFIIMSVVLMGLLPQLNAARLDQPKPGEAPAYLIKAVEKDGNVTFTFRADKSYHDCTISSLTITAKSDHPIKRVNYKLTKAVVWEFTFTLPKDKIEGTSIHLSYLMPLAKPIIGEETHHLNAVMIDLGKFYKAFIKK